MLTSSVVVPTYNRPKELKSCIESILNQSIKPHEIIVVDDGDLSDFPLRDRCIDLGIRCVYHKKEIRGLTTSRNVGVRLATGEIVFFLDDDTVLLPSYIEEILNTYSLESERPIMGVGGVIANPKPLTFARRLRRIFDLIFLVAGVEEGKMLPSGFSTEFGTTGFPIKKTTEVDFLHGGASSFRKQIFADFSFSERYEGYGEGEDKDFTYRVSRTHKLVINPKAKLFHFESPKMRLDAARETREIVIGRYRLFRGCIKKGWWSWLLFCYALFGYLLGRTIIMCLAFNRENAQKVKGILQAVKDILFGNSFIH
jgi:glycosyltransferase involved in cell wall biosynthesis